MKGRKPTAHHLKVIAGTDRPDRQPPAGMPAFDIVERFPTAPQHLDADGAAMWNELGPQLVAAKVLQVVDLFLLEQLCVAWSNFRRLAKANMPMTAADNTALKSLFSEFGMSPASRRKVTSGKDPKPGNPFANRGAAARPTK